MVEAIEIHELYKEYRRRGSAPLPAVNHISFTVLQGECFGLLGPNGAGKSTTINCLIGFYPPTRGSVRLARIDVHRHPKKARLHLGVCAQEDTLDTDFDVLSQLVRHGTYFGMTVKQSRGRAEELLERFRLTDKAKEPIESLSGGMRRKLQVARALVSDPKVLVLDEPTTGLDPDARRTLWEIIEETRRKGTAILLSTHYMDEAERLCDRIAIMNRGRILDIDAPQTLIARHVGNHPIEEEIRPGVVWKRAPNLEDVYLKLTGDSLQGEIA